MFFDTLNLRLLSQVIRQNGANVLSYTITLAMPGAPFFPDLLASPAGVLSNPNVTRFSPDFKQMRMHQANVQLEQELARDWSVTVRTQYYGGRHGAARLEPRPPDRIPGRRAAAILERQRPNPNFNQIQLVSSAANSLYYGGFLAVNKRVSRDFQFTASYRLGWACNTKDSTLDSGSNVTDSTNLGRNYGPSSSDQRHRFVLEGVWRPRSRNIALGG